jgi:hypothetical protein
MYSSSCCEHSDEHLFFSKSSDLFTELLSASEAEFWSKKLI